MLRAFRQSGRTAGFRNRKPPAGQHQIAEGKQREQLCRVLGQPPIAGFAMMEQVLDDMKRMLDFRPHARLEVFQFFRQAHQFVLGQRFAFVALHGHMPRDRFSDVCFGIVPHARQYDVAVECLGQHLVDEGPVRLSIPFEKAIL